MIIYIRHAEDKPSKHRYDEILSREGKRDATDFAEELIEEYGKPNIIYCSPYYRTRQTRDRMMRITGPVKKKIDPRLSRFFTKRQTRNPDIHYNTEKRGAIIYERYEEFLKRVEDQLKDMELLNNDRDENNENESDENMVIWCVSHTLVLKHVARLKGIRRSGHYKYLDVVVVG